MMLLRNLTGRGHKRSLSDSQRQMYASEATENFRLITKIFSKPAPDPLTSSNQVSEDVETDLAEVGEFTELAHGSLDPQFIWDHLEALSQPNFPLDGYSSLSGSSLVSTFCGSVAGVKGFVAYRPAKKQLFVAFSGTSTPRQVLMNARSLLVRHPNAPGCSVHDGFLRMYTGLRDEALEALVKGMNSFEVHELVVTGHSLGGVMSYLFVLDLLKGFGAQERSSLASIPIQVVVFGSPRVGNEALALHWRELIDARNKRGCRIEVFSVKNYNDGATMVPPHGLGFRHFCEEALYFYRGHHYRIPAKLSEWSVFNVESNNEDSAAHPKGGHNYYNSRDMEKLLRRMKWIDMSAKDWEEQYRVRQRQEEP